MAASALDKEITVKIKDLEVGRAYKTAQGDTVFVLGTVEVVGRKSDWGGFKIRQSTFTSDLAAKGNGSLYSRKVAVAKRGYWNNVTNLPTWVFGTVEAFQILGLAEEVNAAQAEARAAEQRRVAELNEAKAARRARNAAAVDNAAKLGVKVGTEYSTHSGFETVRIDVAELEKLIALAAKAQADA